METINSFQIWYVFFVQLTPVWITLFITFSALYFWRKDLGVGASDVGDLDRSRRCHPRLALNAAFMMTGVPVRGELSPVKTYREFSDLPARSPAR